VAGLRGRRILVTRPRSQGTKLNEALEAAGARVLWIPAIEIAGVPLDDAGRALLGRLGEFDWCAFTSESGARHFLAWVEEVGARWPLRLRVAAVGGNTARALKERGHPADLVPEVHTGKALAELLQARVPPARILLPRGDQGREDLADLLQSGGWQVTSAVCYANRPVTLTASHVFAVEQGLDAAVFASPSAVQALWGQLPETARRVLCGAACVPIGPTTAEALRQVGLEPALVPEVHTVEGIVAALAQLFSTR
jgi:uroporphyrinogen III methyltransferase/synthase